jgi:hypothetical protein
MVEHTSTKNNMTILFGLFEFNFYNFEYTFNFSHDENKQQATSNKQQAFNKA